MTIHPSNKHITRVFKYHLGLIAAIPLVILHSANADTINWSNEATDNVGWHTASNWSGGVLPGTNTTDNVIFAANDTPYVTQPGMSINNFIDITIREEAVLTILEDLPNTDNIFLGANDGLNGGHIIHSSGLLAPNYVGVGNSTTASSESSYLIEGDAQLATTGNLVVRTGELTVEGEEVTVDAGGDLDLSLGGDLKFVFDQYGVQPITTSNAFIIDSSNSTLTIDASLFIGGTETIELVQYGSRSGSFSASQIVFEGLRSNQTASISYGSDNMSVTLTTDTVTDSENNLWFSMTPLAGTNNAIADDILLNNESNSSKLGISNGLSLSGSTDLQCTRSTDGDDLVYNVTWSGNDYDGDGNEDTVSFDLRVKAYSGATYNFSSTSGESSITSLGGGDQVTENNGLWGVGSDFDVDEGESLEFTIENINVSASGFMGEVNGFTSFGLNEIGGFDHSHIRGEGVGSGLNSGITNFPTDYDFSALTPLVITSAGSSAALGLQIDNLNFSIKVYNPNATPVWDVSNYAFTPDGPTFVDPYPAQTGNVDFPDFSWNRMPRWLAVRNTDDYTQAQIDSIANNYQLVMMEKSNQNGLTYTEEGMSKLAASLKASSSSIKTIAYWNALLRYEDYEAVNTFDDDWAETAVDEDGNISILLQRDTLYRYNREIPELRDWWVESTLRLAEDPNIDGLFIDVPSVETTYFYDSFGEPIGGNAIVFDAIREAMPANKMLVGNSLGSEYINGHRELMEVFDASYFERWSFIGGESLYDKTEADTVATTIQLMREALSLGKMVNFQTAPEGFGIEDDPAPTGFDNFAARQAYAQKWVDYPLAVFLIAAEENAYFGYNIGVNAIEATFNDDIWDTSFIDQFNRTLGPPLADPTRDGHVYTRSYTNLDVWLDLETKKTNVFWKNDIGNPGMSGSAVSNTDGTYEMEAGGSDISGTSDQFFYLSDSHTSDGEFIARVDSVEQTDVWAKGGIMCRESLDADAANVMVLVRPDNQVNMQWRTSAGLASVSAGLVGGTANVKWVRLVRSGNTYTGYYSTNGTTWTTIASQTVTMDTDIEVGLAATSHNDDELTTVNFSNVAFDK